MKLLQTVFFSLILCVCVGLLPQIAFAGNPPDAGNSQLNATAVPADGTTTSTVTILLRDSSGVVLTGDTVSITAPTDPTAVISPASTTLDGSGQATFTITSTTIGTDALTVDDTTTVTTLVALGNVTFTDPSLVSSSTSPSSTGGGGSSCSATAPTSAPDLYQVVGTKTSVTLYFAPPNSSFDGFTISYGLTTDANSYSVHFDQGATGGAVKYTINDLIPKAIYYFKVAATSGCATGPFSLVVNSKNGTNPSKLLETGPNDMLYVVGVWGALCVLGGLALFTFAQT